MARSIHLKPYLSVDELAGRYRGTKDPVERSHWHFLWLLGGGMAATAVAVVTDYSRIGSVRLRGATTLAAQTVCGTGTTRCVPGYRVIECWTLEGHNVRTCPLAYERLWGNLR
jgi:hypothetical protein